MRSGRTTWVATSTMITVNPCGVRATSMSKWKVFDANTGEVEVETYLKWAAVFIAWVDGLDYTKA